MKRRLPGYRDAVEVLTRAAQADESEVDYFMGKSNTWPPASSMRRMERGNASIHRVRARNLRAAISLLQRSV